MLKVDISCIIFSENGAEDFNFQCYLCVFGSPHTDLPPSFYRFLRVVAYRQFTGFIHGYLKEKRIPLPACAYHAIRSAFKEKDDNFQGYEDLEEAD